jgi:hypothetical protein
VSLIQLLGRLLSPFDYWRARPVLLSPFRTCSWLTTRPFRISSSPFPNQRVLVGMQLDVIGDRLVDEIPARTFLRGGQRIKRFNLFSDGTETDGFVIAAHNARTITHIILYYRSIGNVLNFT